MMCIRVWVNGDVCQSVNDDVYQNEWCVSEYEWMVMCVRVWMMMCIGMNDVYQSMSEWWCVSEWLVMCIRVNDVYQSMSEWWCVSEHEWWCVSEWLVMCIRVNDVYQSEWCVSEWMIMCVSLSYMSQSVNGVVYQSEWRCTSAWMMMYIRVSDDGVYESEWVSVVLCTRVWWQWWWCVWEWVMMMCMRVNDGQCQWCCAPGCDDGHCLRAPRNILQATPSCSPGAVFKGQV